MAAQSADPITIRVWVPACRPAESRNFCKSAATVRARAPDRCHRLAHGNVNAAHQSRWRTSSDERRSNWDIGANLCRRQRACGQPRAGKTVAARTGWVAPQTDSRPALDTVQRWRMLKLAGLSVMGGRYENNNNLASPTQRTGKEECGAAIPVRSMCPSQCARFLNDSRGRSGSRLS